MPNNLLFVKTARYFTHVFKQLQKTTKIKTIFGIVQKKQKLAQFHYTPCTCSLIPLYIQQSHAGISKFINYTSRFNMPIFLSSLLLKCQYCFYIIHRSFSNHHIKLHDKTSSTSVHFVQNTHFIKFLMVVVAIKYFVHLVHSTGTHYFYHIQLCIWE